MSREATVMGALAGSAVPVPHIVGLCRDKDVLGADFYVMDKLVGRTLRTAQDTATLTPEQRGALTESMLDTLVALPEIDPADGGLADWGRPDGYPQRPGHREGPLWPTNNNP